MVEADEACSEFVVNRVSRLEFSDGLLIGVPEGRERIDIQFFEALHCGRRHAREPGEGLRRRVDIHIRGDSECLRGVV